MCGIAGLMTRDGSPPRKDFLAILSKTLVHRGPDGVGNYIKDDIGLCHRRLAVIDLETGHQPISEPRGAVLIANAEIYNYLELKRTLKAVKFQTLSDCEPLIHLYRRDGIKFDQNLRGMYAIAIYDPLTKKLILSRDPFGIKSLYYTESPHGFAFASEAQSLVSAGLVEAQVNTKARDELLELQFTTGEQTIFDGIKRVLPGETIVICGGKIVERGHLDALPQGKTFDWTREEPLEKLDSILNDSVLIHQQSDVPLGVFLSGGVDSATILSLMSRHNDNPILAFTAGFSGKTIHDERILASQLARSVGAQHIDVCVEENDFWKLMPEIAAVMDDPVADYAILPTYILGGLAKQYVKVVLTGEGGDELFGGYSRYQRACKPWWLGGRAMRSRGTLSNLGVLRKSPVGWREGIAQAELEESLPHRTALQVAQAVDCKDWLSHDLLLKIDRCLMAHGVEGRVPFLDLVVAKAVFELPDQAKVSRGIRKYVLRKWLEKNLPVSNPFSKKRGFTVPVGEWIYSRGEQLGSIIASCPGVVEICYPERVRAVFRSRGKRETFAAWTLLFYALWYRRHILGQNVEGDVFEYLNQGL